MAITQEKLLELEAQHKRISHIIGKDDAWEVVLRKPSRDEYKQFRARTHNPAQVSDAQEILVRKIVVYPAPEQFGLLLEDFPAIPEACGDALKDLLGATGDEQGK